MADELGTATLYLEVDDTRARTSLEEFRKSIEAFKPNFTAVERGLKAVASQADQAAAKVQSLNQVLSQAPGASFSKITSQIQRLSQEAKNLKINSDEYLKTLTRISELEFVRGARSGRQRANADAAAASGAVLNAGYGAPDRLPGLPSTIAADQQRIRELTFRLKNLDLGSSAFEQTQRELEAVQRRVAEATDGVSDAFRRQQLAQDGVIRRAEKLKALQIYYSDLNPRAGGVRDPNTGAMLARGSGAASDERAYRSALGASQELLATDLRRLQVIREITQRLAQAQTARTGSFESGFNTLGSSDPVTKSIERNAAKRQRQEERLQRQRDIQESDLARVREQREVQQIEKERATRRQQEQQRAKQRDDAEKQRLAKERRDRNDNALSSGLIGGGFPLLFGQGIGASVGGGIGGVVGGFKGGGFGFALSIVGTALGAQFDTIIAKSTALGKALESPITNFGLVQENALLSSRGLEKHIASLIAVGRDSEAAALIQKDLAASYGGAAQAAELAKQQEKLNRSWSNLSVNLGGIALQPLADSAGAASSALNGFRAILDRISGFVPPQVSEKVQGASRSLTNNGILNAFGLQGVAAGLGFLGAFAPKPKPAPGVTADPVADQKRLSLISAQNKVITAQVQGYKRLALERELVLSKEREAADLERLKANKAGAPEVQARQESGNQERFRIAEELKQADRERLATNALISAQNRIQLEAAQRQIVFAQALAGIDGDRTRSQVQLYQGIVLSTAALRDQQRDLGAQIGAAKIKGGDGADTEVTRLVGQQQTVAEQIRLKLIEGADALVQAGINLRESLTASVLQLQEVRSDPNGLNQYLSRNDILRRQEEDFRRLQPQYEQARQKFVQLTGARPIEDLSQYGPGANNRIADFIRKTETEFKATRDEKDARSALDANNAALVTVNTELAKATRDLALKDWNVGVVVNSQGVSVTGATLGG